MQCCVQKEIKIQSIAYATEFYNLLVSHFFGASKLECVMSLTDFNEPSLMHPSKNCSVDYTTDYFWVIEAFIYRFYALTSIYLLEKSFYRTTVAAVQFPNLKISWNQNYFQNDEDKKVNPERYSRQFTEFLSSAVFTQWNWPTKSSFAPRTHELSS